MSPLLIAELPAVRPIAQKSNDTVLSAARAGVEHRAG
jgi:hypothetical protein